jgi:AcrR family transcriptional regulator
LILAAARARFAAHGYDRTRIRDVAVDAGVDPALVHYFFNTKDGLFVAAMELPIRPSEVIGPLVAEGVSGLGERMLRTLLAVWDQPANQAALLALVQGASGHPGASAALREFISQEIVGRVSSVSDPVRAALVASQIMGLIAARYVARIEPLASLPADEVVPLVAPTLQRYLDGAL